MSQQPQHRQQPLTRREREYIAALRQLAAQGVNQINGWSIWKAVARIYGREDNLEYRRED